MIDKRLPIQSIHIFREHFWVAVEAAKESTCQHYDLKTDRIFWESTIFEKLEKELFKEFK